MTASNTARRADVVTPTAEAPFFKTAEPLSVQILEEGKAVIPSVHTRLIPVWT